MNYLVKFEYVFFIFLFEEILTYIYKNKKKKNRRNNNAPQRTNNRIYVENIASNVSWQVSIFRKFDILCIIYYIEHLKII